MSYWMTGRKWYLHSQEEVEWKIWVIKAYYSKEFLSLRIIPTVLFILLNIVFRCSPKLSFSVSNFFF